MEDCIRSVLKKAVKQSGLPEDKCCIVVKGGCESRILTKLFGWNGAILDLHCLISPPYNRQPACVVSMFRQCGKNFHLNLTRNRDSPKAAFRWWQKAIMKEKDGKLMPGYLHCPLSECLYFKWWMHMWYPFLCYSRKSLDYNGLYNWKDSYEFCAEWMALKRSHSDREAETERESVLRRLTQQ